MSPNRGHDLLYTRIVPAVVIARDGLSVVPNILYREGVVEVTFKRLLRALGNDGLLSTAH